MAATRHGLVADTALEVLARHGSRGLTHRAVDVAAGLPPGSTSYYYRSRAALLSACVARLGEHDYPELGELAPTLDLARPATLADALGAVLHRWLTTDRTRHLARYELSMEAVRRPELAADLHRAGQGLRQRVAAMLEAFGATDPPRQARWLVACIDGILFDNIAGANATSPADAAELHAAAHDLINAVLRPSGTAPTRRARQARA
jgi:DNA-binding transcriptional regulator YbjK